jgi:hypothetical protein
MEIGCLGLFDFRKDKGRVQVFAMARSGWESGIADIT